VRPKKVLIALNTAWNLVNFRSGLIRALVAQGYEVVGVAPPDEYAPRLAGLGCRFVPLPMDNKGTNPGRDLLLLLRYLRLLLRERPDVFLGYTVKPNVYGSMAAHALGIPVINNIAGLGTVFNRRNWLTAVVRWLYRAALSRSRWVFFQNEDDRAFFVEAAIVRRDVTARLPGSGVDLREFAPIPLQPSADGAFRFLLASRMLWDKGVGEYVEAARKVRADYPGTEFRLLGFLDVKNPTAISHEQITEWVAEGVIVYLGATDNVKPQLAEVNCVVLPSLYREGVPRSLLEAAAMAKPIITTDAVGCRDVVDDGHNGFLVKVGDARDLGEKMVRMMRLTPSERQLMGARGRQKMEREFDERFVIDKYVESVGEICGSG